VETKNKNKTFLPKIVDAISQMTMLDLLASNAGYADAAWRQCCHRDNAVRLCRTMLPGGNAVIATMLTSRQCRFYDAAWRQC
jgi:hypothetical protein